MTTIGTTQRLKILKQVPFGLYLDGGPLGEVLLPKRYAPEDAKVGQSIRVFLYADSDDRPIATTLRPKAEVGQCASMRAVAVDKVGAFLDWGLPKDLLVPFSEQRVPMQAGRWYVVYVFRDEKTGRIAASTRLSRFLSETAGDAFAPDQSVDLLTCGRTDLGIKAVINGTHLGMILKDDLPPALKVGQVVPGIIKRIRDDGRIDLALERGGAAGRDELSERILARLQAEGGQSTLTDRSSPEEIFSAYGVSKGSYKRALGQLYKQRLIELDDKVIRLLD